MSAQTCHMCAYTHPPTSTPTPTPPCPQAKDTCAAQDLQQLLRRRARGVLRHLKQRRHTLRPQARILPRPKERVSLPGARRAVCKDARRQAGHDALRCEHPLALEHVLLRRRRRENPAHTGPHPNNEPLCGPLPPGDQPHNLSRAAGALLRASTLPQCPARPHRGEIPCRGRRAGTALCRTARNRLVPCSCRQPRLAGCAEMLRGEARRAHGRVHRKMGGRRGALTRQTGRSSTPARCGGR